MSENIIKENIIKTEIKPENKANFSSNTEIKKNINFIPFRKKLSNIISPENPSYLRRIIKPNFVFGFLIGFSVNFYYNSGKIYSFINQREEDLSKEIKNLKKEIKELKSNHDYKTKKL